MQIGIAYMKIHCWFSAICLGLLLLLNFSTILELSGVEPEIIMTGSIIWLTLGTITGDGCKKIGSDWNKRVIKC